MIEVCGLTKAYGGRPVLRGVNLSVAAGEAVALVGPNGSGKTTLLRCLLGLVHAEGKLLVAGHDPWEDHAAAQVHVAYVPQRAPALPVPVGDLVRAWVDMRHEPEATLRAAATAFGLDLDALASVPFVALSGGMQQKFLAATALATRCPTLVFDEPTANLDPHARAVFLRLLDRHPVGVALPPPRTPRPTLLLSSHRLEEVRHLVDRVVVLADGTVRFDDHIDAFLARPELAVEAGLDGGDLARAAWGPRPVPTC